MTAAGVDALGVAFRKAQAFSLAQRGDMAGARKLYLEITREAPDDPEGWFHLAAVHEALGLRPQAQENYRRTIALDPQHAQAHNNLGALLELAGELQKARHHYQLAVQADPTFPQARFNLGALLNRLGLPAQALEHLQRLTGEAHVQPQAAVQLALALKTLGDHPQAMAELDCVLHRHPDFLPALNLLGNLLQINGRLEQAVTVYQRALTLHPGHAELHNNLGSALLAQGRIAEALASYRQAVSANPQWAGAHSNVLLALNYAPELADVLIAEHLAWAARHGRPGLTPAHPNSRETERRLRVGYLSADLRTHSVAYFIEALLAGHRRSDFEVFAYADVAAADQTTERLRGLVDAWRDIHGHGDEQVAALIQADRIDILVDLGGHTAHNRLTLFARRPAPVQVTYLGYPNTTGLASVQYRFTDRWADPRNASGYTEALVRLDGGFLCYSPPQPCPPVGPPPVAATGAVTFGSFNTLAKMTPEVIELWCAILSTADRSRLLLKNTALQDDGTRERCWRQFERHGVDRHRIALLGRVPSTYDHLAAYEQVDVALDTFPYNGTTTTCEALWMGVPVITLAGSAHAGRVGVSLLTQVGLAELIACAAPQYVEIARALAADTSRLADLRSLLRERMGRSSLCNAERLVEQVETGYRSMWRTWCERG